MVKIKRVRTKPCSGCEKVSDTLFRVRIKQDGEWIFVCPSCLDDVKPGNRHYRYGGTWKSKKRH